MRIRGLAKRSRSWRTTVGGDGQARRSDRIWRNAARPPDCSGLLVLPQTLRATEAKAGSRADSQPSLRAHALTSWPECGPLLEGFHLGEVCMWLLGAVEQRPGGFRSPSRQNRRGRIGAICGARHGPHETNGLCAYVVFRKEVSRIFGGRPPGYQGR
jgi:hypothetical protein